MYFSADAGDGNHVWRQDFPRGVPEQGTFGPTEEEGIAVSSDGRTLVTSAGISESTVWVHDSPGDHQVSGEGFAMVRGLRFAGGANTLCLFTRREAIVLSGARKVPAPTNRESSGRRT